MGFHWRVALQMLPRPSTGSFREEVGSTSGVGERGDGSYGGRVGSTVSNMSSTSQKWLRTFLVDIELEESGGNLNATFPAKSSIPSSADVVSFCFSCNYPAFLRLIRSRGQVQRNALSVIEAPTGHEEEDENDCENRFWSSSDLDPEEFQKPCKPRVRPQKLVISVSKTVSRNNASDLQSADSKSSHGMPRVNLSKLETAALWRYWRHFNLVEVSPNPSKEQLVHAVERHFISQQLDELQVIAGFVQAAKRLKTVCG